MAREATLQVRMDVDLIAQAKVENMMYITHDLLLPYYMERCILAV